MMERVTDPELIKQLNSIRLNQSNKNAPLQPVTDPGLIKQLDSERLKSQQESKGKLYNFAKEYIPEPGLPPGINIASGLMSLSGQTPEQKKLIANIPQVLTGAQPGIKEKIEQGIGQYLPAQMTGINSLTGLGGIGSRALVNSLYGGAINKENISEGMKEGLVSSLAGDIIPGIATGIGKYSEFVNPIKFVSNKINSIKNEYNAVKELQRQKYRPVNEKYNDYMVTSTPEKYLGFTKKDKKYFTPEVNKAYGDFIDEPNFKNLHTLQSIMGSNAVKSKRQNVIQTLNIGRNKIKKIIENFLSHDPESLALYKEGSDITKNILSGYESTPLLRNIISGLKKDVEGKKLISSLSSGAEKEAYKEAGKSIAKIPEGHSLRNHLKDLEEKFGNAGLLSDIPPTGLKGYIPNIVGYAQKPEVISAVNELFGPYKATRNALLGYDLNNP